MNHYQGFFLLASIMLSACSPPSTDATVQASSCPYIGGYIDCVTDGQSINWCKQHVLNCKEAEEQAEAQTTGPCLYPSYPECLLAGETVDWCKQHVLNCEEIPASEDGLSIVVPYAARVCLPGVCWPCFEAEGVITYLGDDYEEINGQLCLRVTDFEYVGDFEQTVRNEVADALSEPNPDCDTDDVLDEDDAWCVCAPLECIEDLLPEGY